MSKVTLTELDSLTNETTALTALNTNFQTIQDAIDLLFSRDGTSPNTMEADVDMNSFRIENLPEAVGPTEPIRLGDIEGLIAGDIIPSKWYNGTGAPDNASYDIGDYYLDTATEDVYEKTGESAWTLITNIKGATGATGATGPAGAGSGDMLKSTYDTNDNGIVDAAASVPWSGVTGRATTLSGYGITDAQPLATKLTNFNALTWAANTFPTFTGTSTVQASQITTAGLALLDDADASAQRTTLGLGTMALRNNISTGDLVNGSATLAKLDTTGASGLVLTAQGSGSAPIWASPASSASGHVLLTTVVPTATSTMTASGLTLTPYRKLLIEWTGVKNASISAPRLGVTVSATTTWTTLNSTPAATSETFSGFIEVNLRTGLTGGTSRRSGSTTLASLVVNSNILSTATSLMFSPSTGNFQAGGAFYIYGVL